MNFRQKISKLKIIKWFTSIKLTVVCLCLLFLLTLSGTIAQIQDGLYLAQQRYFESFFFLIFGFIPFPGAQGILWVLFINLICVALTRFAFQWQRVGILIIHSGLLLFLTSGYVTLHLAKESHLTLEEGHAANVSTSYHNWEIAIWPLTDQPDPLMTRRDITSIESDHLKANNIVNLKDLGFQIIVKKYYNNSEAYVSADKESILSSSGISRLEPVAILKEPEKNIPGGIFTIQTSDQKQYDIFLFGSQPNPLTIDIGNKKYAFMLRLKHYPLPFTLKLKDFKKEIHPGTETPRKFQSLVEIQMDNTWREKLISMNEPLRYKDYTFYQASFSVDQMGQESSTLAVVKNAGRLMPYISTFVTFLGLVTHFGMMALKNKKIFKTA